MNYLKKEDAPLFENKTIENFKAVTVLVDEQLYNAASTRIYYSLIHLALRNAAKYEVSRDIYTRTVENETKINKTLIEQNAKGLHINNYKFYRVVISRARSSREKADYLQENVIYEEIEDLLADLDKVMEEEGIRT